LINDANRVALVTCDQLAEIKAIATDPRWIARHAAG
jgi:hypothetical protein